MTIAYKFWHQVDGVVLNDYCYSCDWDINITFSICLSVLSPIIPSGFKLFFF